MRVAIHQPHYFPWLGYFDKMAKADVFVLLDEVQFEKNSYMARNRIIDPRGDLKYLIITIDKKGYCEKKYSEINTVNNEAWRRKNLALLTEYYRKAPFHQEIIPYLSDFYQGYYETVCEWTVASILLIKNLLNIKTELVYQKNIVYDRSNKKSDMDMEICKSLNADTYLSGRGASLEYLNRERFAENGIKIVFQNFSHPIYPQINTSTFVSGISILDMLFNCGIEESRCIFWENVKKTNEFKEVDRDDHESPID